jgi:hypothetical protein
VATEEVPLCALEAFGDRRTVDAEFVGEFLG